MTFADYQSAEGVSKSMLNDLSPTPAHFYARHIAKTAQGEESEALSFGRLFHGVTLDGETAGESFHIQPETYINSKGKECKWRSNSPQCEKWDEEHSDKPVIKAYDLERAQIMCESVHHHRDASRLLKGAQVEQSLFATDDHGTKRKGRLDIIPKGCNALADLKSVETADPDKFEKQLLDYRWFVQAAYYLDLAKLNGIERDAFAFVLVEKKAPYLCAVYTVAPEVIELGRKIYQRDLAVYRHCMETGSWPGYQTRTVGLPAWAQKQMEAVL